MIDYVSRKQISSALGIECKTEEISTKQYILFTVLTEGMSLVVT